MERPMTEWNDDRLDELNERVKEGFADVDKRFAKVDERFVRVESEMKEGFAKVDERFLRLEGEVKQGFAYANKRMEAGFERINDRLDRFVYLFVAAAVGLVGTGIANSIWG